MLKISLYSYSASWDVSLEVILQFIILSERCKNQANIERPRAFILIYDVQKRVEGK